MMTIFLHADVQDPFGIYNNMLLHHPVYWDEVNKLWAIYSYEACSSILKNEAAIILDINANNKDGLNKEAVLAIHDVARLSNGLQHDIARQAAMFLFDKMKTVSVDKILTDLLPITHDGFEMDWIGVVCKKLPIQVVVESFEFTQHDCAFIASHIDKLVKIMLPNKTQELVQEVNEVTRQIYRLVENHLQQTKLFEQGIINFKEKYSLPEDEISSLMISNLIGLMVQCYDAGRGLLGNAVWQDLRLYPIERVSLTDKALLEKFVVELLRFMPPVHNTRRVSADDILYNDVIIKKGDTILLMLAAANRDSKKFALANTFNIDRPNNKDNLSFGTGSHGCLATYFSMQLDVDALHFLFTRYKSIRLCTTELAFEPVANARLPKQILLSLSK